MSTRLRCRASQISTRSRHISRTVRIQRSATALALGVWYGVWTIPVRILTAYLADLFELVAWWRLRPAPELVAVQLGLSDKRRWLAAAEAETRDLALVYVPKDRSIELRMGSRAPDLSALWFDPRSGQRMPAIPEGGLERARFKTPSPGDWLLLLGRALPLSANASQREV